MAKLAVNYVYNYLALFFSGQKLQPPVSCSGREKIMSLCFYETFFCS